MNRAHLKILALWDSSESLAKAINANSATVRKWRQRGQIPPKHWNTIAETEKARAGGITLKMLAELPRKQRKVQAQEAAA